MHKLTRHGAHAPRNILSPMMTYLDRFLIDATNA
jgi:hypothetical protein